MLDFSNEKSSLLIHTGNVTAASLPGLITEVGALRTAIEGITLGVVGSERLTVFDTTLSNTPPTDELAQVESAWLVTYADVTPFFDDPVNAIPNAGYGKLFNLTIGTADVTGRLLPGTDLGDMTNAQINAFVQAFEQTSRSPCGGRTNVIRITFVGRKH